MAIHLTCADLAHFGQTIPKYAFKDRKDIGSVVIPGTVATIEANAFQRCVNLKQVRVITCGCAWQWPNQLIIANITCTFHLLHLILTHNVQYSTTPHAALFIPRTSSCAVVCMPASGLPTSILMTVLRSIPTRMSILKQVTFASAATLQEIGNNAFLSCKQIRALHLPGSVRTIGSNAFSHCFRLADLTFGDSVEDALQDISDDAFQGCDSR